MKNWLRNTHVALLLLCAGLFVLTGCSPKANIAGAQGTLPQVSGFAGGLQDIELPTELTWDRDASMTIKTASFNGGIWCYEGRVDVLSLKDYLVGSMQGNKWKLVGESTSKNILLAFVKPHKTCMIVIAGSKFFFGKTKVTLYVTIDRTAAAGLNPFGEAVDKQ